jgi:hypothetical protein
VTTAVSIVGLGFSVVVGTGGPLTVVDSAPHEAPDINDQGTVVFAAGGVLSTWNAGVLTRRQPPAGLLFYGSQTINNSGAIAAYASQGVLDQRIVRVAGSEVATIYTAGPQEGFGHGGRPRPVINDSGAVAFLVSRVVGAEWIHEIRVGDGVSVATVVDTTGPFASFGSPAFNNLGKVAFVGSFDTGGGGIFTGPDPARDAVIRIGDQLFGSTVVRIDGLYARGIDMNDAGQVAFVAGLADGRVVVVRADPQAAQSRRQ